MRIAIVQLPGSINDHQTAIAVQRAGMDPIEFPYDTVAPELQDCTAYILIGSSCSLGDSPGLMLQDEIIELLHAANATGKPILGIDAGAQILVQTGLVPGLIRSQVGIILEALPNDAEAPEQVQIRLSDGYQLNAFTRLLSPKKSLNVFAAQTHFRFVVPPVLLREMQAQGLDVFHYCDGGAIAAVSNKAGNVMAMLPHVERTVDVDIILQSMRDYIKSGYVPNVAPLTYYPRQI